MLQLTMKCWNSAFDAPGPRLITVVVQLGAVKISLAAVEALSMKLSLPPKMMRRWVWNSVYHQNWWFSEFHPRLNANVLFCKFFWNLTLCMYDQNSGFWCCVFLTSRITLLSTNSIIDLFLAKSENRRC
jgi:hypothetical protein